MIEPLHGKIMAERALIKNLSGSALNSGGQPGSALNSGYTDKTPSKLKKFHALIRVVGAHGPDGTQGQRGLCSGGVSN